MNTDEFAHLVRQLAGQQNQSVKPVAYAHIATYDPLGHRVRVVIPSLRDDDTAPTLTGWMPLLSSSVGPGYGVQIAPFGGATVDNPTAGEQVIITLMDLQRGSAQCACMGMTFNGPMQPPAAVADSFTTQPLQPGEAVVYNQSGTFWRLHANGDVETNAQGNILMTGAKEMTVNTLGDVVIQSAGTITIGGADQADILSTLVNLGGASGGRKIARDGDPVVGGVIQASTAVSFST